MTREEAIQFLDNMRGNESGRAIGAEGFYAELCGYHVQALNIAIKALSQQTEDAISRQAALEKIHWLGLDNDTTIMCDLAIRALPSVIPSRLTGHWILHTDASGNSWHTCPACGHIAYTLTHFCPDCGERLEAPA